MATISFDRINRLINVSTVDTEASIQELYDSIQNYQDEPQNMDIGGSTEGNTLVPIGAAEGKATLSTSPLEQVGVTLTLYNDWRVSFGERSSADNVIACAVRGGNLVAQNAYGNNPIFPTLYTQVQIRQSQAPTLISGSGGGISSAELADQLSSIATGISSAELADQLSSITAGISSAELADQLSSLSISAAAAG